MTSRQRSILDLQILRFLGSSSTANNSSSKVELFGVAEEQIINNSAGLFTLFNILAEAFYKEALKKQSYPLHFLIDISSEHDFSAVLCCMYNTSPQRPIAISSSLSCPILQV